MSSYLRGGKGRTVDASYPVLVVVWWFRSGSSLPDYFSVRCSPEYPPWLFISPAKAKSTITFPNCSSPLLVFRPKDPPGHALGLSAPMAATRSISVSKFYGIARL